MKTYLKLTMMIFAAILMVSCEEEISVLQPLEAGHVQLQTSSAISVAEDSSTGTSVKFQLGTMINTDGYTANFTVESSDNSRYIVSPSNGEIYFEPNTYETSITVVPVDNLDNDGNITLTIALTGDNVGVYGNDELRSVKLTIQDNDCPTEISKTYTVTGTAFGGFEFPEYDIEFVEAGPNTYYVSSLWGTDFLAWATGVAGYSGLYVYPGTITLNNDFTVTVNPIPGDPAYYVGGTGTYSACDDQFTVNLTDGVFSGGGASAIITYTGKGD